MLAHDKVHETVAFWRLGRRGLRSEITSYVTGSLGRANSAAIEAPVVELDVLVQDPQALVDHQGCQRSSELGKDST